MVMVSILPPLRVLLLDGKTKRERVVQIGFLTKQKKKAALFVLHTTSP